MIDYKDWQKKMNKIKIIALCGKAGSGKDTILKEVITRCPHIHEIVSCTTRPRREGEVDGVNYHYLTNEEFAEKVLNNDMLEATIFNDWCYGTSYSALDPLNINIGVFNPEGISILQDDPRISLDVYYIWASGKTRLLRQLNREGEPDVAEIIRRYGTDEKDFSNLQEKIGDYTICDNESQNGFISIANAIGQQY